MFTYTNNHVENVNNRNRRVGFYPSFCKTETIVVVKFITKKLIIQPLKMVVSPKAIRDTKLSMLRWMKSVTQIK